MPQERPSQGLIDIIMVIQAIRKTGSNFRKKKRKQEAINSPLPVEQ
jgi:hypothetical protein